MDADGVNKSVGCEDTFGEVQGTRNKADLAEGTHVHRYIILGLIGKGGMGAVYKAYDPELDRNIALKMLSCSPQQGQTVSVPQARLMREAQALAKLNHPNVVFVFDVGTYEEGVYIAMEYVEGKTFREWIKDHHPTQKEITEVMLAAGKGLQAAHLEGIVHRDFKPENLLVGKGGQVKVLDFGLARAADFENLPLESSVPVAELDLQAQDQMLSQPLTQVGTLIGTAAYMAPEHFLFQELDEKTDQFSFCITLFEALYGKRPFAGNNQVDLAQSVTQGLIQIPDGVSVPDWMGNIIQRGLSVTKEDRFPSMGHLLQELENDPRQVLLARRQKQVRFVLFLVIAMLPFVVWYFFVVSQESCTGAEKKRIGVWDNEVKQEVNQAFVKTNLVYAPDTFVRVEKNLDSYLDHWASQYTSACTASREHGEPVDIMVLKMGCLERQLKVVAALIRLFRSADSTVVAKAVRATSSLSDLSNCQDVGALQSRIDPPKDNQTKARVELVRENLFRVEAFEKAGKYQEGLKLSQQAWKQAQETLYRPVHAEAMFWLGFLQERIGDYVSAKKSLENAAFLAVKSGHGEIRAKALIQLLWVVGYRLVQLEEAMKLNRWTEAAVVNWGDREQESWWLNTLGLVLWKKGDYEPALKHIQQSRNIREKALGPKHPDVAASLNNIALVLWQKGEFGNSFEYFRRSLETFQATLGPAHPDVATCLTNLGSAYTHKAISETP